MNLKLSSEEFAKQSEEKALFIVLQIFVYMAVYTLIKGKALFIFVFPSFRQSVTSTFVYSTNDECMHAWSLFVAELAQVAGLRWGCCLTCGPAEAACQGPTFSSSLALMESPRDLRERLYNCSL